MKIVINIVAVILILVGIVWFLQGINILPGSFMTGNSTYAILGVVLAALGIAGLIYVNRRPRVVDERRRH